MTTSREKGKQGERLAARVMESITGVPWRRTQQYNGAGKVGDVEPLEVHPTWSMIHVEVKNVDVMGLGNVYWQNALTQATADCPPGRIPCLLWRVSSRRWAVTVWDHLAGSWATYNADQSRGALDRAVREMVPPEMRS